MYKKLQYILLELVRDHTLTEVSDKYFDGGGLGYLQRVMAGKTYPMELMVEGMLKKVPKKYHEAYDKYVEYEKSFKGW